MEINEEYLKKLMCIEQSNKQKKYANLNSFADKGAYVIIGDSIVEGFPTWEMLKEFPLYNRGIGSDTTTNLIERLADTVYALSPSKVLIWVGTNDIPEGRSVEDITSNVHKCACLIKEKFPQTDIFILSVTPVTHKLYDARNMHVLGNRNNEIIQQLNTSYKILCEDKGYKFIDFYDKLVDEDGELKKEFTVDGLHPTVPAYVYVAEAIKKAL